MTAPLRKPAPAATVDTLGYTRVSTDEQAAGDRASLTQQRAAITALAARRGHRMDPALIFEDPGASGATAEGRPGFMALLAYCEAHPRPAQTPGEVFVLNDSRWGRFRDPDESTFWRVRLAKLGWRVRFAEGDETDDPLARGVLRAVHSATASAYRDAICANAKRGARGTAERGYWQNEAPLGYRRLAHDPVTGKDRTLEPGQRKGDSERVTLTPGPRAEVALVRWVFERYATGEVSLGRLMRELTQRWPARAWSRQTVRAVLKNVTYTGTVVWCRRPHDAVERRATWIRPKEQWVIAKDAHPALVPQPLFDRVQATLARNLRQTRATAGGYPLSGLLRCSGCGRPYIGGGGSVGPEGDRDRYRFYKCVGSDKREDRCPGPVKTIGKRLVEPLVIEAVAAVVRDPAVQQRIATELRRQVAGMGATAGTERQHLDAERRALEAERERLVAAVARGTLTDDEVRAAKARIQAALDALTSRAEQTRFDARRAKAMGAEEARLMQLAADFPARIRAATGAQARELLRPWLADAIVDHANRKVTLYIRRVPLAEPPLHSRGTPGRG